MSLDITLYGEGKSKVCYCAECGHEHTKVEREMFYSCNITHNLNAMADAAGIYEALWRPHRLKEGYNIPEGDYSLEGKFESENPVYAREIIGKLGLGLDLLKKDPEYFKKYNSPNGWGLYDNFVPFVEGYLNACIEYPDALVYISR